MTTAAVPKKKTRQCFKTMIPRKIIRYCIETAKSLHKVHPNYRNKSLHFTFVFDEGRVISFGMNRRISASDLSTRFKNFYNKEFLMLHSELDAIRRTLRSLRNCSIINIRVNRAGTKIMTSKPCPYCAKLLWAIGIREIYYVNAAGKFERVTL
jgi:tRNA(Arg) A34 adenosine deaminase TadA